MHTLLTHKKQQRWLRPAALACILLCCVTGSALWLLLRIGVMPGTIALPFSARHTAEQQGIDPTMLFADPTSYDTRPCVAHPSTTTCNGRYPESPPHVDPQFGAQHGAGACIDGATKTVEHQVITDGSGQAVGTLDLVWLPTCQSYYGEMTFNYPLSQVQSASIQVQTETSNGFLQWFDAISQLPPLVTGYEETGPLSASVLASSPMLGQTLISPLIFSPGDPVSAHIDLEVSGGISFANYTASYSAGIKQYIG